MRIGRAVFTLLVLCDALAAPFVPETEGNRKIESMQVSVGRESGRIQMMPLENYVAAVLARESGNFTSLEALKAMAVAVRSYAIHFRKRHRDAGFDFCDNTHCQDLRRARVTPLLARAAEETSGEMVWFDGSPAAAYYHADCGGRTEAVQYVWGAHHPYLRQRSDRYCATPRSAWESAYSKGLVQRALAGQGLETPEGLAEVKVVQRTPTGRASRLMLLGERAVLIPAGVFRRAMQRTLGWRALPSVSFTVRADDDRIIFAGRGLGHAVGLCQAGAERMGRAGKGYRDILGHYYPGTVVGE